jgi:hypothetical protein
MDAGFADVSPSVALRATGRCLHRPYTGAAWGPVSMSTHLAHAPPLRILQ